MQMQDKQPQPQSRPPIRFADTPDYIGLYTAELLQMKAQGKSHGEMLSFLHTKRVYINMGEIAAFWQDYAQKQKEQQRRPETTASNGFSITLNGHMHGSVKNPEPTEKISDVAKPGQPNEQKRPPDSSPVRHPVRHSPKGDGGSLAGGDGTGSTNETASKQSENEKRDQDGFIAPTCQAEALAKAEANSGDPYEVPLLWDYAVELVALRDVGKSDDEILAWLRTRENLCTNATEIAKVLDYYEKYQEELEEDLEQIMERDLDEEREQPHDPEEDQDQGEKGTPPVRHSPAGDDGSGSNTETVSEQSEKEKRDQDGFIASACQAEASAKAEAKNGDGPCPPMAIRRPHTPADFDISAIMDRYKVVVERQVAKDEVTESLDPESRRVTQRMISTLIMYKHSLERREERMMALKIKTEEHELKKSKAAAAASQEEEEAKETAAAPAQKKAPNDFDNTALIEQMRRAYFKNENALLASGLVDELLVAVENQTKAMGAQVQGYVPPPLGTGLWSKPTPVPDPGVPPTPAAASSGIAKQATTEATGAATVATPADVMARIIAFLAAYAKKEAADSSGMAQTAATEALATPDASSHPSSHAPTAQPFPIPEKPVPTIGPDAASHSSVLTPAAQPSPQWENWCRSSADRRSDEVRLNLPISQQPAKPGPTAPGTAPAINPSG